jgi:O-antigen/teichoic acid export membrane protein
MSSIKKNIVYNVSLSLLNILFPIVTTPYISRVLGVENIGVVRFVVTCVGYFAIFAAFGIGYYGVRELAKHKDNQKKCSQLFSSLFTITMCSTIVVTLLFLLSINLVPEFKVQRLLFSLYGITLYLTPITMDWYFQAKENFRIITFRSFIVKLLAFVSLFIFVRERNDVIPYLLISTFSIIATQIWNLSYAYKTGLRISLCNLELRQHVKPMFVFLTSSVAISFFTMINIMMLGFLSSYEQIGYYTSSDIIIGVMNSFLGAIAVVLLPRISSNDAQKADSSNSQLLQKTLDATALLCVPMAVGLCLTASRFVPLFFGSEFEGSIVPLQIVSFRIIIVGLNYLFGTNMLLALGHEKKYLLSVICSAVLSFVLNLLLLPHYGAVGAAIVIVVADFLAFGFILYFVYKVTIIRLRWSTMGISALSTMSFFILYFLCRRFIVHDVAFLCIFISSSVVVYFGLQLMAKNNLVCEIVFKKFNENKLK